MSLAESRNRVGLLAIAILSSCLYFPILRQYALPFVVTWLGVVGVGEFYNFANQKNYYFPSKTSKILTAFIILLASFWNDYESFLSHLTPLFAIIITILFLVFTRKKGTNDSLVGLGLALLSIVYISVPLAFSMILAREYTPFLFFGLCLVWASDSGAYFIGKKFGKHKLAPIISPKKTIEGLIGGAAACLLVALIFHFLYTKDHMPFNTIPIIVLSLCISILAPVGDLLESVLKRDSGVKDSGKGLGGHGGVLDRLDSLFICLPVYMLFVLMFKI